MDSQRSNAFSIHISRNLVVQGLGMGMVSLAVLSVAPLSVVLVWSLVAVLAVSAENRLLRRIAKQGPGARRAERWAPVLRVATTSVYALAAYALLTRGSAGERFFALALISASMVHVLMRYYRAPVILVASICPYLLVVGAAGVSLAHAAWAQGHGFGALAYGLAVLLFAVQFWSARAQLSGAWVELMAAREAAEERERYAEAANLAKSQFLAMMSHELRTPLNGVLGMAQALAHDELTRVQKERVGVIRRSGHHLLAALDDLLDLSKVEAGALTLDIGEFDLEHLVRGVAAVYQPQAAKKKLGFGIEIAADALGPYRGDAARIRRILYSLCDNAVKFTEAGEVTLRVERDAENVRFQVSDTGVGLAEADLGRLFEGFFQGDASNTRRHGGAGVGLAICREFTALMGGAVEASNRPGGGAIFTVTLPLERVASLPDAGAPEADVAASGEELRVLAAEDNPTNQLVLQTLLAPAGIAPKLVVNGREALAAWEDQPWDLVLMDIQMPEMDGVQATREIRLREQATGRPRTPIVAVTANAMAHQLGEYEAAGIDAVVAKPVDAAKLFDVMEQVLAGAA